MTQEDKELLFKDLSARLPYHVRLKVWLKEGPTEEGFLDLEHNYADVLLDAFYYTNKIKDIKPYLRPMSSMTEEEEKEFKACHCVYDLHPDFQPMMCTIMNECNMFDWLNAHHFDYRGLIPKGLALVAPKDMYNDKK